MLHFDIDKAIEYIIKRRLIEGKDKDIETHVNLMENQNSLSEIFIVALENRIGSFLQMQTKVNIARIGIIEKYIGLKTSENYKEVSLESIKKALNLSKKYCIPEFTQRLKKIEEDVNTIITNINS